MGHSYQTVSIEQVYHFSFVLCFLGEDIYGAHFEDAFVIEDT